MNIRTLIAPATTAFLLGISCVALADDQSKADKQPTAEEPVGDLGMARAAHIAGNTDELAKQLSNPISSLISVPFQYNYSRTYNDDGYKNLLNIQPVVPISISENWDLISRTIVPVIQQNDVQY